MNIDQNTPFKTCQPNYEKSEAQKLSQAYLDGFDDGFDEGLYQSASNAHRFSWFAAGYALALLVIVLAQRAL